MRVFVRPPCGGATVAVEGDDVRQLAAALQARLGVPPGDAALRTLGGRPLRPGRRLDEQGVAPYDTLELCGRLLGGQPVKVRLLTPTPLAAAGTQVTIDLDADTPMHEAKRRLAAATGLPVEAQRLMLGGIGDLVLLDKRTNLGASYCGSTNNFYFATLPASEAPTERKAA